MRGLLFAAAALLAVLAGLGAWFVLDANRLKPSLEAHLERAAGTRVEVRGGLTWRFMPRMWLVAEGLRAADDGRVWSVQRLELRPGFFSLVLNPLSPDRWRIDQAVVRRLAVDDAGDRIEAPRLSVHNIGLGEPAAVSARVVYLPEGGQPLEATLDGIFTVEPERLGVRDLSFRLPGAAGRCDLQAMPNGKLWPPRAPLPNELLPVHIMRTYDWDGRCDLERVGRRGEAVEQAVVVLDNKEGGSVVSVDAPDFLGGSAQLEAIIRADASPVTWQVRPVLAGVDSRRLANWLGGVSLIAAPVDFGATISMSGNTPAVLAASLAGDAWLSTGPGEIDAGALTAPLTQAMALLDSGGAAPAVPATLAYENLRGTWSVEGARHRLELAVDSLEAEAHGYYLVDEDRLELRGVADPGDRVERWGLPLAPALAGAPFHFLCRGSAADPRCRLDVRRTLLGAGAAEGGSAARELIDRHVPEEYQAAARSLLGSLEDEVDAALRKDPDELIGEHVPERYQDMARSLLDRLGKALDENR